MSEREQVRAEDGNRPLRFVRYLLKFIAGFLAVSIPLFALVAVFLRISPARLIAPFLLILATAFLVGPLVYFAGKNKERPIVFSLFISFGVGIYLLVFQLVVIYFGTEFWSDWRRIPWNVDSSGFARLGHCSCNHFLPHQAED